MLRSSKSHIKSFGYLPVSTYKWHEWQDGALFCLDLRTFSSKVKQQVWKVLWTEFLSVCLQSESASLDGSDNQTNAGWWRQHWTVEDEKEAEFTRHNYLPCNHLGHCVWITRMFIDNIRGTPVYRPINPPPHLCHVLWTIWHAKIRGHLNTTHDTLGQVGQTWTWPCW